MKLPAIVALLGCSAGALGFTAPLVARSTAWTGRYSSSSCVRPSSALKMAASQDELKQQVGYKAVDDYVKSGMVVGLGTGSTAAFAVERLGQLLKDGTLKTLYTAQSDRCATVLADRWVYRCATVTFVLQDIIAIPTSVRTKEQAEGLGIPLTTLDEHPEIDVAIDGADTVDNKTLALVKGGGGALLRENAATMHVLSTAAMQVQESGSLDVIQCDVTSSDTRSLLISASCNTLYTACTHDAQDCRDASKMADGIGPHFDLPVEIIKFCSEHVRRTVENLPSLKGCKAVLRKNGSEPYVTDNDNYIIDLKFEKPIADADQLSSSDT
eukprot:13025-Heterococcus_DN1.PRE.3